MEYLYRYKYLPFSCGSLKVLTEGTIKFTCPNEFNDPFDSKPHYDPKSFETIPERRPELLEQVRIQKNLTQEELSQQKESLIENLRKNVVSGKYWQSMISGVGVLSLSREPLSILMWSHYADNHKGFLVEFKIPTQGLLNSGSNHLDLLAPFKINYVKNRPKLNIGDANEEKSVDLHLLMKSYDWKYEEEERVINHIRGPGIYKFDQKTILESVICGCKMEKDKRNKLFEIIKTVNEKNKSNVQMYSAKEKSDKYELYVPNHPRIEDNVPNK